MISCFLVDFFFFFVEDGKMRMMNDRSEHRTLKCALIPNNRKSPKECTRRLVKRISFDPKMDQRKGGSMVLQYKAAEGQILAGLVLVRERQPH